MKKALAILLILCMVFALAACGSGDKKPADGGSTASGNSPSGGGDSSNSPSGGGSASTKDTLTVAMAGDNGSLNPFDISGGFVGIVRQYMEVLLDYKQGMEKVWVLATDIEEVSTSQWIIHLREGVTFSNGNKFDAHDVWFTFEYCMADPVLIRYIPTFDLENSKVLDDYTIDLRLKYYEVTQMDALSMLYILDAESFDEDSFVTNPIGTGPYVVTDYVINSHVHMKANENYWGGKAKIENLNIKVLNEDSQMVNAIQAGTVDVTRIPTQDVEFVETLPGYNIETVYNVFCPNVSFNVSENSIFNNLDARIAVCHALNRQTVIDLAYFGYASIVDYPISMYCRDYESRLANLHPVYSVGYNLDLAKEHAEKAGLVGQDIVVITNGSSQYIATAEIMQANLKEIGVNVIIQNYDAASYYSVSTDLTRFDISLYATASPQQLAVGMLYSYVLYSASLSAGGWPGYDRFMEIGVAAIANPSTEERSDALFEMTQIFTDACLWYGLCDQMAATAVNVGLGGVEFWSNGDCRYGDWYWK